MNKREYAFLQVISMGVCHILFSSTAIRSKSFKNFDLPLAMAACEISAKQTGLQHVPPCVAAGKGSGQASIRRTKCVSAENRTCARPYITQHSAQVAAQVCL